MIRAATFGLSLLAGIWLASCTSGGPRSTRLTTSDFDATVSEVVEQLAASDFLRGRTPQSAQVRLVTRSVENLTSDVISPGEQWMLIARVQGSLPAQQMAQQKNLVFQIPPEEIAELRRRGFDVHMSPENEPTHVMAAVLRSSTRAGRDRAGGYADIRKEYYFMEYVITDLKTGAREWSGSFAFAREAAGLAID